MAIFILYRYGGSPGWDKFMWVTANSDTSDPPTQRSNGINSDGEFFFGVAANGMFMLLLVQTIGAIGGDKSFFTVSSRQCACVFVILVTFTSNSMEQWRMMGFVTIKMA